MNLCFFITDEEDKLARAFFSGQAFPAWSNFGTWRSLSVWIDPDDDSVGVELVGGHDLLLAAETGTLRPGVNVIKLFSL